MPIGKDSITKRVAKTTTEEKNIAPELVATTAAAPVKKAPAKKTTTTTTAKKSTSTAAKKPAAKKDTVKGTPTPSTEAPEKKVNTAVLTNVAPETVEAVIGHKEDEKYEKVQIGQKMPSFLL